jgi:hypothetical protein
MAEADGGGVIPRFCRLGYITTSQLQGLARKKLSIATKTVLEVMPKTSVENDMKHTRISISRANDPDRLGAASVNPKNCWRTPGSLKSDVNLLN